MSSLMKKFYCYVVMVLLAGIAFGKTASASEQSLITQAIDNKVRITLNGSVHPLALSKYDQGEAPGTLKLERMKLFLKRSASSQKSLNKLVAEQQDSASPNFHKWLSPSEFGAQFGVSDADLEKIEDWLRASGFSIDLVASGQNVIVFSGTHEQVKSAFNTSIHSYLVNGVVHHANSQNLQIPAALASVVNGVVSLNDFESQPLHSAPQQLQIEKSTGRFMAVAKATTDEPQTTFGKSLFGLSPYDVAIQYNIKPLWDAGIDGTGQSIAIVGRSDINVADIDAFRSQFGLPATKLTKTFVTTNPGYTSSEPEGVLDVEWVGAVAKKANIIAVIGRSTANSDGVDDSLLYIVNNNVAPIMNVSYGSCELANGIAGNAWINEIWEQAAAQGITVVVATGDSGAATCDQGKTYADSGLQVNALASTPYDISIGGTDLYASFQSPSTYWKATNDKNHASLLSYIPESVWNDSCASPQVLAGLKATNAIAGSVTNEDLCNNYSFSGFMTTSGGGGGVSNCTTPSSSNAGSCSGGYSRPAWQSGVAGLPADGRRHLPDVSFMAGDGLWGVAYLYCQSDALSTGACDVSTGYISGAGGTSFAAPIFSGVMALIAQQTGSKVGNPNYVLYQLAATQYADSALQSQCQSSSVVAGNSCIFYDVSAGNNRVLCDKYGANCVVNGTSNYYGITSGYDATPGYDNTSGLGTINVANLVNRWSSVAA